jgi:hypothetical protein
LILHTAVPDSTAIRITCRGYIIVSLLELWRSAAQIALYFFFALSRHMVRRFALVFLHTKAANFIRYKVRSCPVNGAAAIPWVRFSCLAAVR